MKKLLVLLLVLGMASAANATLEYRKDATSVTVFGLLDMDLYIIVTSDATLSPLSSAALDTAAPTLSDFAAPVAPGDGGFGDLVPIPAGFAGGAWVMASAPGEAYVEGDLVTLSVSGSEISSWWFDELTGNYGEILPEPMTVAFLGLGGLLMLRRRK